MKELAPDIILQLKLKFGDNFLNAKEILTYFIKNNIDHSTDRIIRCIIFLSTEDLENLKAQIKIAKIDWRDIIEYAEYDDENNRIRNFNKTFLENNISN
ncbi:hypothetical protein [Christiangramia echinicola]|uniref:Uncharacterized protein n=1 Tax=Christiangramia echinicola TaxID=279359 RepID=A0A1H1LCF0_9FLAO|nr:hypothetical protein [Christiangramia echinicola]SDR71705.1 hypothetical protein SAMN04488552_0677 [Christiangramia echinicola]